MASPEDDTPPPPAATAYDPEIAGPETAGPELTAPPAPPAEDGGAAPTFAATEQDGGDAPATGATEAASEATAEPAPEPAPATREATTDPAPEPARATREATTDPAPEPTPAPDLAGPYGTLDGSGLAAAPPAPAPAPAQAEPTGLAEPPAEAPSPEAVPARRLYVLTDAGKPIWTSTGEPTDQISPLMGMVTAVIGFAEMRKDQIKALQVGRSRMVLFTRGALVLLAVSSLGDTESYLSLLLETLYQQILFVLTTRVHKVLASSGSYDLRNLLGGTDNVMHGLADSGLRQGSILTGAVRSMWTDPAVREEAGRVLATVQAQAPETLYGILLVGDRLLTILQPKQREHQMRTTDLLLIINFVVTQPALRSTESWTPLCLPRFNPNGFLHSYIGYCDEESDLCLLLVSTSQTPETFHAFQQWREAVTGALRRDLTLEAIQTARKQDLHHAIDSRYSSSQTRMLHFLLVWRPPLAEPHSASAFQSLPAPGSHHQHHRDFVMYQYHCPNPVFPLTQPALTAQMWAAYQRSALRLRHGSASPEHTLPSCVPASESTQAEAVAVARNLWETTPVHEMVYHSCDCFMTMGVAAGHYELHATFPSTVSPGDALASCHRLLAAVKRDEDWMFYTKPISY